jgi:hypothetical protein
MAAVAGEFTVTKAAYRRPVLKHLGRMDLVRKKSTGTADGGGNDWKNV